MNIEDRPTPETHAARFMPAQMPAAWNAAQWCVQARVAETLERQKAALREALEMCERALTFRSAPDRTLDIARATLAATKPTP